MFVVLLLLRLVLAIVFFIAALSKLFSGFDNLRKTLLDFGPRRLVIPISIALPLVELVIAGLLLPATTTRIGAVSALVLFLIFNAAMAANLAVGRMPNCNCS